MRPEVFGLSTLDTVTCALGGSIMLFVSLAAGTVPEAPFALVDTRVLFQSGAGTDGLTVSDQDNADHSVEIRNLAMIYVDTQEATFLTLETTKCTEFDDSILPMGSSSGQYFVDTQSFQHAFAIWHEDTMQINCKRVVLELSFDPLPSGCQITLVSGNHYQQRPKTEGDFGRCPQKIQLRSNGDGVFQFGAGS